MQAHDQRDRCTCMACIQHVLHNQRDTLQYACMLSLGLLNKLLPLVFDCLQLVVRGTTTSSNPGISFENSDATKRWRLQPRAADGSSAGFATLAVSGGDDAALAKQAILTARTTGGSLAVSQVTLDSNMATTTDNTWSIGLEDNVVNAGKKDLSISSTDTSTIARLSQQVRHGACDKTCRGH